MKISRALPLAALGIALGIGANNQVHAYAYAQAQLELTDFTITVLPKDSTLLTDFRICAIAGCAAFDTPSPTTTTGAALGPDDGTATGENFSGNLDALVSIGENSVFPSGLARPAENTFGASLEGASATNEYSWADAQVISEQAIGDTPADCAGAGGGDCPWNPDGSPNIVTPIETNQIAEANTTDETLGTGGSTTGSVTEFEVFLEVTEPGARVRFDLTAFRELYAEIVDPSTGQKAEASASVVITLNNTTTSSLAFQWTVGGNAAFGTATNAYSLSGNVGVVTTGSDPGDGLALSETGVFFAITDNLAVGEYSLTLLSSTDVTVQAVEIPEPSSLALVGLGLLAAGFRSRRKLRVAA